MNTHPLAIGTVCSIYRNTYSITLSLCSTLAPLICIVLFSISRNSKYFYRIAQIRSCDEITL